MATEFTSPISPMSAKTFTPPKSPNLHSTHLSGATMTDLIVDPKVQRIAASAHGSIHSPFQLRSNRVSVASTTKSELRRSNQILIEMLQNIQTELAAHRTIMLDIQHRVSYLEQESVDSVGVPTEPLSSRRFALQSLEGHSSSKLMIPPESQSWWQNCQNFANNCDSPISAHDFLRTPRPISGMGWPYGGVQTPRPRTPPATPPKIDELPPLTPTSDVDYLTDVTTPQKDGLDIDRISVGSVRSNTPKMEESAPGEEIKAHVVEVDEKKLPPIPVLQPPPVGKGTSIEIIESDEVGAHSMNSQRLYKGVKSLITYKALLRNKATEKEHEVLIHFHRRADLNNLGGEA